MAKDNTTIGAGPIKPESPTYLPISHILEHVVDFEDCPNYDLVFDRVCDALADMGIDEDCIYDYMLRHEDNFDFDFDYHDYDAEANRGFMADNGWGA